MPYRGIFNKYQKSKGIFKYLVEDIRCVLELIKLSIQGRGKITRLVVYPHYPSKKSTIYRIAKHLGLFLTNKLDPRAKLAVYWEYKTFRDEFVPLEKWSKTHGIPVLNLKSRDISKYYVDEVFNKIFGYSTRIDPLKYKGPIVAKSDINAKHDGRILEAPLNTDDLKSDTIYQKLINNSSGDMVKDYRVPVYNSEIPFVYLKYRPKDIRFTNATYKTVKVETSEVFTEEEIKKISEFSAEMFLDHGELDILRDKDDKIYIVDVNNTPQSPPTPCSRNLKQSSISKMADSFSKNFIQ